MTPTRQDLDLAAILAARTGPVRITVGYLKGGTGKSTTAVMLALALHRATGEPVLLVDADRVNVTTTEWAQLADDWPEGVTVERWPDVGLAEKIAASGHTGHVVIDTGPSNPDILMAALTTTDYLVVPITATGAEATPLQPTLSAAATIGRIKPIELNFVFTRTKPNTRSLREAKEALSEKFKVLDTDVPFVLLYMQAFGTVPDDLGAYPQVLAEILGEEA